MPGTDTKDAPGQPLTLERKSAQPAVGAGLISADDTTGVVEALVSVTGIEDAVKDTILPGAYTKTIAARRPKGIFGHDWGRWVARTEKYRELMPGDPQLPKTTPQGAPWPAQAGAAYVKARFNLATQEGREAYENVKFFSETGECEWSIGYQVPAGKSTRTRDGGRQIKELDWYEYSPVLFGAAPLTGTLSVKAAAVDAPIDPDLDGDNDQAGDDPVDPVTDQADADDPEILALHEKAINEMDEDPRGWEAIDVASAIDPGEEDLTETADPRRQGLDLNDEGTKVIVGGDAGPVTLEFKAKGSAKVSDKPWSDFSAADYTPAQYHRACLIHDHGAGVPDTKQDCHLPVREPDGTLNRNGVHAAANALAGARGGVQASGEAKAKAKAALRGHYRTIGDDPPESLSESKVAGQELTPAEVRATDRLKRWYVRGGGAAQIGWGTPGDFMRCSAIAGKHMRPDQAHGFCQLRHKDATGFYAGHAPTEQVAHIGRKDDSDDLEGGYDPVFETGDLDGGGPWDGGTETKDAAGVVLDGPAGSLEEHLDAVADAVADALGGGEQLPGGLPRHLVVVNGTWSDHVIATRFDAAAGGETGEAFQITYNLAGGGVQLGDPEPVVLTVTDGTGGTKSAEESLSGIPVLVEHVTGVIRRGLQVKEGRVLSQVNVNLLRSSVDQLISVLRNAGIPIDVPGNDTPDEDEDANTALSEPLYLPDSTAPAAQVLAGKSLLEPDLVARALRIHAAAHSHGDDDA